MQSFLDHEGWVLVLFVLSISNFWRAFQSRLIYTMQCTKRLISFHEIHQWTLFWPSQPSDPLSCNIYRPVNETTISPYDNTRIFYVLALVYFRYACLHWSGGTTGRRCGATGRRASSRPSWATSSTHRPARSLSRWGSSSSCTSPYFTGTTILPWRVSSDPMFRIVLDRCLLMGGNLATLFEIKCCTVMPDSEFKAFEFLRW